MCYHVKTPDGKFLKESAFAKDYEIIAEFDRYYHAVAFDHPQVPVITNLEPRMIQPAEWGLVTSKRVYEDTARKMQKFTVNAVGEELFEKKSYKDLAPTNRCIIIVEGFYEWMHVGQGKNAVKYPFFVQPRDEEFFLLGGIWNDWTNVNTGEEKLSAVVITTAANPLMAKIHNSKERMPFILDKSQIQRWLDPGLEKDGILNAIKPYDENKMKAHTISKKFNQFQKGGTNVADICEKVEYSELQKLG
jgi:putative SOS response-associated peptidase YedK